LRNVNVSAFPSIKCLIKGKTEGEYWTVYKELMDDEEKGFPYFRLCQYQFNEQLEKIKAMITKEDEVLKEALCKGTWMCMNIFRHVAYRTNILSENPA
jgi:hypothetical protein